MRPPLPKRAVAARRWRAGGSTSESGGRPVPASRIRPERSRAIDVIRISRPARETRAMPLVPKRVSSVPSGLQADHRAARRAGGGQVGAGDERRVRRAAAHRRRADAGARRPGPSGTLTMPGAAPNAGSSAPVGRRSRRDAVKRRRARPPTVKVIVPSGAHQQAGHAARRARARRRRRCRRCRTSRPGVPSGSSRMTSGAAAGLAPPRMTLPSRSITIAPSCASAGPAST